MDNTSIGIITRRCNNPNNCVARILDGSELREHKARYDTSVLCGLGAIDGHRVGLGRWAVRGGTAYGTPIRVALGR